MHERPEPAGVALTERGVAAESEEADAAYPLVVCVVLLPTAVTPVQLDSVEFVLKYAAITRPLLFTLTFAFSEADAVPALCAWAVATAVVERRPVIVKI